MKIYFKDKEVEELERELRDLEGEIGSQQEQNQDPYLDPALENEYQEIRKVLFEKSKQCDKIGVQVAFQVQQLQHRARDIMTNLKNNNEVLGEFVQPAYIQLIEQEVKTVAEKLRKNRQSLNSLNDEIKGLEKEHPFQVDSISSQKRMVNEERKKKEKLKDEIAMYKEK